MSTRRSRDRARIQLFLSTHALLELLPPLLFGLPTAKDDRGTAAADPDGPVPRALRAIRGADLALVADIGLRWLRYGPPYYRAHAAPGKYDWEFTDLAFGEMRRLGIVPIVDLCHFGVPDWAGDFQNPEWPKQFAEYAGAFARRFPWVRFYTPVNEIYVCAKLSTLNGIWNERRKDDDRAFVTALKNMCRADLLAIQEILKVRPDQVRHHSPGKLNGLFIQHWPVAVRPSALATRTVLLNPAGLSLPSFRCTSNSSNSNPIGSGICFQP